VKGAVLYLKACQVLLQQSIGGYVVIDIGELNVRPKRTRSGIPRIIPAHVRSLILKERHIPSIRLWMTLFGLFRILEFPGKLKLTTITDAGVDLVKILPKWDLFLVTRFAPQLKKRCKLQSIGKPNLYPILKSGPTSVDSGVSTSAIALIASARLWLQMGTLLQRLGEFATQLGATGFVNKIELVARAREPLLDGLYKADSSLNTVVSPSTRKEKLIFPGSRYLESIGVRIEGHGNVVFLRTRRFISVLMKDTLDKMITLLNSFFYESYKDDTFSEMSSEYFWSDEMPVIRWSSFKKIPLLQNAYKLIIPSSLNPTITKATADLHGMGYLGKLGIKLEPAGKIRVFAMVDAWTQWLMYPFHKWIFSILRDLSASDGTFDQLSPVERLQVKYTTGDNVKGKTFSSIDLSVATDRLPLKLQQSVLKVLLKDLLPDSELFSEAWGDILVKRSYKLPLSMKNAKTTPDGILYSVGQPMGALSSWAMLAITHHAIVQFAAYRAGYEQWFPDYAVLGDDIVIMDGNVANCYRQISVSVQDLLSQL